MPPPAAPPAPDTWNSRFDDEDFHFGVEPNAFLVAHRDLWRPGERVLCVADGEGRNSVWLAGLGLHVDAFDFAAAGVAKARRLAAQRGVAVNYAVSDCDSYPWPEDACDGVVAIFVQFADPAMRARLFASMKRCLVAGGRIVLLGYTPKQLEYRTGGPPQVEHLYTAAMLRTAFADCDIVELTEYEAELAEGRGHAGRSALVGLVARRR